MLRSLAKRLLYRTGVLQVYHRLRNRHQLTVAMFHRVLAEADPRWQKADPAWTVSAGLFEECLDFFHKHYHVVSLEEVLQAWRSGSPLPDRPLLITFDDGWADNAEYALPALQKRRLPAVLFAVAGGIGQKQLWREKVFAAWRLGRLDGQEGERLWNAAGSGDAPSRLTKQTVWSLINRLAELEPETREALLQPFLPAAPRAELLSGEQVVRLQDGRISIGSHTLTHTPVPLAPYPEEELGGSRKRLAELLPASGPQGPVAFSFPHGLYDTPSIQGARSAGYQLLFTSDPALNALPGRRCEGGLFGRINIDAGSIQGGNGRLRPELLALWLFARPRNGGSCL